MIEKAILVYLIVLIFLTLLMLFRLFRGPGVYDRFVGILVMSTNAILILILIGFVDGRRDMYVDVAVSYAILGFISSVIVAKFMGSRHHDHLKKTSGEDGQAACSSCREEGGAEK